VAGAQGADALADEPRSAGAATLFAIATGAEPEQTTTSSAQVAARDRRMG